MEDMYESLTPQERIQKFNADAVKKNMRIRDLQKRLASAQASGNKQRVEIIRLDMELAKLDIQRLHARVKKEQLKLKDK